MEMLSTQEVAELYGCSDRNIRKKIMSNKINAVAETNEKNKTRYLIPLDQLSEDLQHKYYQSKGILKSEVRKDNSELDSFSSEEREEIAFWNKIIENWQAYRNADGVTSKAKVDEKYIAYLKLEYPDRNFSLRTLYRKLTAYKENDIKGLADMRGKARKGQTEIDETVWQVFLSFYLDQAQHPIRKCLQYTEMYCRENYPELVDGIPAYCTFTRHIKSDVAESVKILGREGDKAFDDRAAPYIKRTYDNMRSNEYWVGDNHTFDILVQGDNGKMHRLYLTAFFDARSGIFTGCYVTTAPSSQSTIIALRRGIMKYGIPENLYLDNGREFLTFDLGGLGHRAKKNDNRFDPTPIFERLGIKMVNALVRNAKAKVIERRFLDIKNGLSRLFCTYTGGTVVEKPEILKKILKDGKNLPTDEELTRVCSELIENYFNFEPYNGAVEADRGTQKIEVYYQHLITKRVAIEADLNLMLLRSTRAQKVTRRGVHLNINGERLDYWNNELVTQMLGKQVFFRYDPEDLSSVRLYDLNDRYIMSVPVDNQAVLEYGASQDEVKQAMQTVKQAKKVVKQQIKDSVITSIDKGTALELVLRKAEENKKKNIEKGELEDITIQKADEKPLLHDVPVPDLQKMAKNAMKRQQEQGGSNYA